MNYLKDNPVGVDVPINTIQKTIYAPLVERWGNLDIYGRVYKKTDTDGKVSLERYIGNGEYKKVLSSEGNKIFFIEGPNPELNSGLATNDIWLACIVNIEEIKNIEHRADEEVHMDLLSELYQAVSLSSVIGIEYGMENFKRVVDDVFEFGNFKYSDIHPYHVFTVRINAVYSLIENNC